MLKDITYFVDTVLLVSGMGTRGASVLGHSVYCTMCKSCFLARKGPAIEYRPMVCLPVVRGDKEATLHYV
jgi:hypothetical protein